MADRKFLVVVRAGDESLHPEWLKGDAGRTWDLIVSYFGSNQEIYRQNDVVRVDSKGPKWPALYDLMVERQKILKRYEYVWFPDDDLLTDKETINRLFDVCVQYSLEIAQPALTWDSHTSHMVTLRHSNSIIRYTNFVEIMAPCFSAAMLERCTPLLGANLSGWGLDFIWKKIAQNPDTGLGVIDVVTVRHTRPIGGPNYNALKLQGKSPYTERESFLQLHCVDPTISVHKAVTRGGTVLEAKGHEKRFMFRLLAGCAGAMFVAPSRMGLMRQIFHFVRSNWVWGRRTRTFAKRAES